jgi:hypothetical protein
MKYTLRIILGIIALLIQLVGCLGYVIWNFKFPKKSFWEIPNLIDLNDQYSYYGPPYKSVFHYMIDKYKEYDS